MRSTWRPARSSPSPSTWPRPSDGKSFEELAPRNFSFNSPYGACPHCDGLGTRFEVDPDLVVPDPSLSLAEGALAPWASGHSQYYERLLESAATELGEAFDAPWETLAPASQKVFLYGGLGRRVQVRYRNRYGRTRSYNARFEGVIPNLQRLHSETGSDNRRQQIEGYMREVPCAHCGGARLRPLPLAVTIDGRNINDICTLSIADATEVIDGLRLSERDALIADQVLKELRSRLSFLLDVGLDYLSLARSAGTLSGGEAQRIRLASQIGSGLVGVLYVLDEPSIGAAPARQRPPAGHAAAPAGPGQHRDRRGARRGDDPHRRPRGGHRPRAPAATAATSCTAVRWMRCCPTRPHSPASTSAGRAASRCRRCAARRARTG